MASTRGRCAAAALRESMIWSKCHWGSDWRTGSTHLLAEDHLAVNDGGGLAIARPQVETDAASVEVAAQRHRGGALRRQLIG